MGQSWVYLERKIIMCAAQAQRINKYSCQYLHPLKVKTNRITGMSYLSWWQLSSHQCCTYVVLLWKRNHIYFLCNNKNTSRHLIRWFRSSILTAWIWMSAGKGIETRVMCINKWRSFSYPGTWPKFNFKTHLLVVHNKLTTTTTHLLSLN